MGKALHSHFGQQMGPMRPLTQKAGLNEKSSRAPTSARAGTCASGLGPWSQSHYHIDGLIKAECGDFVSLLLAT